MSFLQCPHDETCPRLLRGSFPCHSIVSYQDLAVGKRIEDKKELLSYVVIKKGNTPLIQYYKNEMVSHCLSLNNAYTTEPLIFLKKLAYVYRSNIGQLLF